MKKLSLFIWVIIGMFSLYRGSEEVLDYEIESVSEVDFGWDTLPDIRV